MENDTRILENQNLEKKSVYRTVKTYVLRVGRMTEAQLRDYKELSPVYCIPYEHK